jgi:hypothetical protein
VPTQGLEHTALGERAEHVAAGGNGLLQHGFAVDAQRGLLPLGGVPRAHAVAVEPGIRARAPPWRQRRMQGRNDPLPVAQLATRTGGARQERAELLEAALSAPADLRREAGR